LKQMFDGTGRMSRAKSPSSAAVPCEEAANRATVSRQKRVGAERGPAAGGGAEV
jgi:hypothetical protein